MGGRRLFRGLLFDFDGLILDTELPAFEAWRQIYEEHGGSLTLDVWSLVLGGSGAEIDHIAELGSISGQAIDVEAVLQRRLERKLALIEVQEVLPGVLDYVAEGSRLGFKMAVVSSSTHSWVDHYLEKLRLFPQFDTVVCGEDALRSKPDPDLYQKALESLHLRADETIAFEDSPNGITAAQAAGVYCVAVPNAISSQLSIDHADCCISSLADMPLPALLQQIRDGKASHAKGV